MLVVLVEPRTVTLEYWLNPGQCGGSNGCSQDCVVGVLVVPRTVGGGTGLTYDWMYVVLVEPSTVWSLEYWLNQGLCSGSTGESQNCVAGVLIEPMTGTVW